MIHLDVTKTGATRHHSGLNRLNARLREEFGTAVAPVAWDRRREAWRPGDGRRTVGLAPTDWLLTTEQFCEKERPGFWRFLRERPCRLAAVFADAIPLTHPQITWPQSVARFPEYLKMLATFDRVWAISEASRRLLAGFWTWQEAAPRGRLETVVLGADGDREPRQRLAPGTARLRRLVCVGILEPRKNQDFLLEVCAELWREGLDFELHVAGRVNPHFGRPVAAHLRALAQAEPRLRHHGAASDALLAQLYAQAKATVFPTITEGCGLPVLESLWKGLPCVCSDLPVLREITDGGGCLVAPPNDPAAWRDALRAVLTDDATWNRLVAETGTRPLPTWADTAQTLLRGLA